MRISPGTCSGRVIGNPSPMRLSAEIVLEEPSIPRTFLSRRYPAFGTTNPAPSWRGPGKAPLLWPRATCGCPIALAETRPFWRRLSTQKNTVLPDMRKKLLFCVRWLDLCTNNGEIHRIIDFLHLLPQIEQA